MMVLIHGLRIHSQGKRRKDLKWFEELFVQHSSDDQPLQVDDFRAAVYSENVSTT